MNSTTDTSHSLNTHDSATVRIPTSLRSPSCYPPLPPPDYAVTEYFKSAFKILTLIFLVERRVLGFGRPLCLRQVVVPLVCHGCWAPATLAHFLEARNMATTREPPPCLAPRGAAEQRGDCLSWVCHATAVWEHLQTSSGILHTILKACLRCWLSELGLGDGGVQSSVGRLSPR